jgi:hypothetical protein
MELTAYQKDGFMYQYTALCLCEPQLPICTVATAVKAMCMFCSIVVACRPQDVPIYLYHSNKSPTRCNSFPVYYPDVYLQLNMFRAFSRPSSGAQRLQWQPLVLPSYRGDSCAVFVVGSAGRTQHGCHHDTKVKLEAATAVVELLMMGGKTPETC